MRYLIAAAALAAALPLLAAGTAQAREYPWCAIYLDPDGSAENCGFVTLQQCRATISGVGGICQPNARYIERKPVRRTGQQRDR